MIITNQFSQTRHVSIRKRILKVKGYSTECFSNCMKYNVTDLNLFYLGDNNHLGVVVRYLEVIYTTLDYPKAAPALNVSLRDSGKSRADFWAFAAMMAVEFGKDTTNIACIEGDSSERSRMSIRLC